MSYSPAKSVKIKEDCQNADVFFSLYAPGPCVIFDIFLGMISMALAGIGFRCTLSLIRIYQK